MAEVIEELSMRDVLGEARARLRQAGIEDPGREARLLAASATGNSLLDLVARPDLKISAAGRQRLLSLIERRIGGEPAYRIIGSREFYGLELRLSAATLEPRPDTETLVNLVLPIVRRIAARTGECRILDLGTGTGAIAMALLSHEKKATAVGADISQAALATAEENANVLGLGERYVTLQSDWYENVTGLFHLIVSNPPYIESEIIETLDREVRDHDPRLALDGGKDGLNAYRAIAAGAHGFLVPSGHVAVETGRDQKRGVVEIFRYCGFGESASAKDLGGRDRALLFAG